MDISPIAVITLSILLFEHCTTVTLSRYTQQRTDVPRVGLRPRRRLSLRVCHVAATAAAQGDGGDCDGS